MTGKFAEKNVRSGVNGLRLGEGYHVKHKICQFYLDELLKILRLRLLPALPKTAKNHLLI